MKIIVGIGHPAHFHLFKNFILRNTERGNVVKVVITEKDILKTLLIENNIKFEVIASRKENETLPNKVLKVFRSSINLNKILKEFKPDLLIGCLSQLVFASFLKRTPILFFGEDDIAYTLLQGIFTLPFISYLIAPNATRLGFFNYKKISYNGFQKLAYLHPNLFTPDRKKVDIKEKFFILRFASLSAYHDGNAAGINNEIAYKLVKILTEKGKVIITSERDLPESLEKYRFRGNLNDIHYYLYYADLYVGDSQSMAVESAMLGTPNIRFNDFIGKIGVLEELENKYGLTCGIHSSKPGKLISKINEFLNTPNLKQEFKRRRNNMLSDKIDVTAFMVWFIDNYPESVKIIKENPDYQSKFK